MLLCHHVVGEDRHEAQHHSYNGHGEEDEKKPVRPESPGQRVIIHGTLESRDLRFRRGHVDLLEGDLDSGPLRLDVHKSHDDAEHLADEHHEPGVYELEVRGPGNALAGLVEEGRQHQ